MGNKITDKITSTSKKSKELPKNEANNEIPKEKYLQKKDNKLLMN